MGPIQKTYWPLYKNRLPSIDLSWFWIIPKDDVDPNHKTLFVSTRIAVCYNLLKIMYNDGNLLFERDLY